MRKAVAVLFSVVMLLCVSVSAYAAEAAAEETGPDGKVIHKCPRCGEPLVIGHEHVEDEGFPISAGVDLSFNSKYMWRGINLGDDPVFQPAVWANYKGLTLNVWGNMNLTDIQGEMLEGDLNEVDYTVDYSWAYDKHHFSVGGIHYEFPHTKFPSTTEVYGAYWFDTILSPTIALYYDFQEADGFYGTFTVAHSQELPKLVEPVSASLTGSAQLGVASKNWSKFYYTSDHTVLGNALFTASLPIGIGDHFTVKPTASYSTTLDRTVSSKLPDDHEFFYGVTLSASF